MTNSSTKDTLIDVGFLYPVIGGQIYVAQRNTDPYKKFYGPIGGKSEAHNPDEPPYIKDQPAHKHIPYSDILTRSRNKEYGHTSAVREFYEEAYQLKLIDWNEISDLFKIGSITDQFNGLITNCQFYLARLARSDFNPNLRELSDIKPLIEIEPGQLFPLAQASLYGLKKALDKTEIKKLEPYQAMKLQAQTPDLRPEDISQIMHDRHTSIKELSDVV